MMLLVCSSSLFAQNVDSYGIPVNSLNIQTADAMVPYVGSGIVLGLGTAIGVGVGAAFVAVLTGGNADVDFEAPKMAGWCPFVTLGYEHHFPNTRWSLGPEVGYWHTGTVSSDYYQHVNLVTLAAAGKLYYKPAGICKLYGGLNLGAGTLFSTSQTMTPATKAEDTGAAGDSSSSSDGPAILPLIQFNPIGMRLGSEKVAFLAELGIGYKGFLQLGINVAL